VPAPSPGPPGTSPLWGPANAADRPTARNCAPSRWPKRWRSVATKPAHPVWWLAPVPTPLSPSYWPRRPAPMIRQLWGN